MVNYGYLDPIELVSFSQELLMLLKVRKEVIVV